MRAMILSEIVSLDEAVSPLQLVELPVPEPEPDEILIKVRACGVCHTELDAIIDTTPAWKPVIAALAQLKAGGRLIINAISKEDSDKDYLLNINYQQHLWMEKEIKSVANITHQDIQEFLQIAAAIPIKPEVKTYKLEDANIALMELKHETVKGAKVLLL